MHGPNAAGGIFNEQQQGINLDDACTCRGAVCRRLLGPDDVGSGKETQSPDHSSAPDHSSTPAEGDMEKLFNSGLTLNADQFRRANPELSLEILPVPSCF